MIDDIEQWKIGGLYKVEYPEKNTNPDDGACAWLWTSPLKFNYGTGKRETSSSTKVYNGEIIFVIESQKDCIHKDATWWKVMTATTMGWLSFDFMKGKYPAPFKLKYFTEVDTLEVTK